MADVNFNQEFSPAEATRGSWAPIDGSTISGGIPSASRGKYSQLNYIVGSEPGALSLALSGGTVILPVSTVNITEPVDTTETLPDTTEYFTTTAIAATSVATYTFSQQVRLVEVYNNDSSLTAYVGFNNVPITTLSAQAIPLAPESFYSVERVTTNVYVGNVDTGNTMDVRVVGHYTA